jgi:AmpE protein
MALIIILITLVVQRFASMAGWFKPAWFELYLSWIKPFIAKTNKWLALLIIIAPIFLVLAILDILLTWRLFGLFYLVLGTIILLLCMDARSLKLRLNTYFEAVTKQDVSGAKTALAAFTSQPLPDNLAALNRRATKIIFAESYIHIFSFIFWFAIFGIYGATAYVVTMFLRQIGTKGDSSLKEITAAATFIQDVFDWVPVRLLGFSYALVGHFSTGFSYCMSNLKLGLKDNLKFATESGLASLGANVDDQNGSTQENEAAIALVDRALIIWLMAIALITLGMLI